VGVARLMKDRPMDLGQYVLTIVLQLAHDDENEELVGQHECAPWTSVPSLIGFACRE
jgi:hypothetical protein